MTPERSTRDQRRLMRGDERRGEEILPGVLVCDSRQAFVVLLPHVPPPIAPNHQCTERQIKQRRAEQAINVSAKESKAPASVPRRKHIQYVSTQTVLPPQTHQYCAAPIHPKSTLKGASEKSNNAGEVE